MKKHIESAAAPKAIGPYSQAISAGGAVYVSGQLPTDPETGKFVSEEIMGQTEQCLKNLSAVIEAAGLTMNNVVKITVLLSDMANFTAMNEIYRRFFFEPYPARVAYEVAKLPQGALVEIEAIAVRD